MNHRSFIPYLVLLVGVLIVSTASILIRLAQNEGLPALEIATGRLGLAALILTPVAWWRVGAELCSMRRRDIALGLLSGAFLSGHFAAWISSLVYTSVASSVAMVSTNPLWVGLASLLFFRERLNKAIISGIGLTTLGIICIALSDSHSDTMRQYTAPLLGNGLALLGALAGSGYFLFGRDLRRRISVLAYIWLAYTSAAGILLLFLLVSGWRFHGYTPFVYLLFLALALGPQLLGHTAFNWSLRYLSATFITIAILGEPIGSALLAVWFFQEEFALLQLFGFVILLIGIAIAAVGEQWNIAQTT